MYGCFYPEVCILKDNYGLKTALERITGAKVERE